MSVSPWLRKFCCRHRGPHRVKKMRSRLWSLEQCGILLEFGTLRTEVVNYDHFAGLTLILRIYSLARPAQVCVNAGTPGDGST